MQANMVFMNFGTTSRSDTLYDDLTTISISSHKNVTKEQNMFENSIDVKSSQIRNVYYIF